MQTWIDGDVSVFQVFLSASLFKRNSHGDAKNDESICVPTVPNTLQTSILAILHIGYPWISHVMLHRHHLGGQVTARAMHNSPFRLLRRIQQKTSDPLSRSYASSFNCNCDASYKMFMWHLSSFSLARASQSWLALGILPLKARKGDLTTEGLCKCSLLLQMKKSQNNLHSQDRSSCANCRATGSSMCCNKLSPCGHHLPAKTSRHHSPTGNRQSWHLFSGGNESWNPTAWTNPLNKPWVKSVGFWQW